MLTVSGSIARQRPFDADVSALRELFLDLPALLKGIPLIDSVESYDDNVYRIIMKKIGALGFHVWLAADVQVVETEENVIEARTLPFDPADPWIGEGVLLYEYTSHTRLVPEGSRSRVDHAVDVKVHVPLPAFLRAMPLGVVKGAADSLMNANLVKIVDDMESSARRLLA